MYDIMAKRNAKTRTKPKMPRAERPVGVSIISVLGMLFWALMFLIGLLIAVFSAAIGALLGSLLGGFFGAIIGIAGLLVVAVAAINLYAYYMLWKMKHIGFILVIVFNVIGLLGSFVTLGSATAAGIIIHAVILYYLYKNKKIFK